MRKMPRAALIAFAATVLLGSITFAHPTWPRELGLDFWALPQLYDQLEVQRRRAEELTRHDEATLRRLGIKEATIDELLDGLIGLREAAGQFLAVSRQWPEAVSGLRLYYRGATDEQRAAQQVIVFVCGRKSEDARVTEELVASLEREAGLLSSKD
jgi:hypothetical protein